MASSKIPPLLAKESQGSFLVASHGHWKKPLLSQAQVEAM